MKRKPAPSTIAKAGRLTLLRDNEALPDDRLLCCNLCGLPAFNLRLVRECDDNDRPKPGDDALLYVGAEHAQCSKLLDDHARLYIDEAGEPGKFGLCADCTQRGANALKCLSPFLKTNGGPGLTVTVDHLPGIICRRTRGKCDRESRQAVKCSAKRVWGQEEQNP